MIPGAAGITPTDRDQDGSHTPSDCDDADPDVRPGVAEVCDGVDNDCSGVVDDDPVDGEVLFPDADGDGQGATDGAERRCSGGEGWLLLGGDCDDGDPATYSGAVERCDGRDNDCDGAFDEDAVDARTWYVDADGDGFGSDEVAADLACSPPEGAVSARGDCDDADHFTSPIANEDCDGVDNDCNGVIDDNPKEGETFFPDRDGDGYGDAVGGHILCGATDGWVSIAGDCDDFSAEAQPGAEELCDGRDNDCDGIVDPDATAEIANSVDDDCDGFIDEDFVSAGVLVVTELARQPYVGGSGTAMNANAQWFEVHNSGSAELSLDNWLVIEQDGDHFLVAPDAHVVIPAGEYAVFCYDDAAFVEARFDIGIQCDYLWGANEFGDAYSDPTFYFDRDEDVLELRMDETVMDEVHWSLDEGTAWPMVARHSMELDAADSSVTSNDSDTSWCLAAEDTVYGTSSSTGEEYGTPGAPNGDCP